MSYLAQWGPKGFLVSPEKIVTFDGFSTSIELSDDSQKDTSGKAPTNTKGKKKQVINFSITYSRVTGTDPRGQFEEWESLVGSAYPLYIGGKRFGPENIQLKKADLSGLHLANDGTFLTATVAVSFEEFVIQKVKKTTKSTKTQISTTSQNTPLTERQKSVYDAKVGKLLAEKEKAMATADAKLKLERQKLLASASAGSGGGGYKYRDDNLIKVRG